MANKKYDNEEGVWRTIGGRRVFIKTGQSLEEAMKESGKFSRSEKNKQLHEKLDKEREEKDKYKYLHKTEDDEFVKTQADVNGTFFQVYRDKDGNYKDANGVKLTDEEVKKFDLSKESEAKHSEKPKELSQKEIKSLQHQARKARDNAERYSGKDAEEEWKKFDDINEKLGKDRIDQKLTGNEYDDFRQKALEDDTIRLSTKYLSPNGTQLNVIAKDISDRYIVNEAGNEYRVKEDELKEILKDGQYSKSEYQGIKKENKRKIRREAEELKKLASNSGQERISKDTKVMRNGDDYIVTKNGANKGEFKTQSEAEEFAKNLVNNETMNEKIRAKASKKSKSSEPDLPKHVEIKEQGTSNRKEVSENIQAHILEHYDSPQDFIDQMDNVTWQSTNWRRGQQLAEDGFYEIYYEDQRKFLDDLKINPKGKELADDKVAQMYNSLIGRESERLYERLKKNAYNEYKKEHPLTKMTFEEFKNKDKK